MSNLPLRYQEIEPDRRSELSLLDKISLIDKIVEYESQVIFDPEVLVDETSSLVESYEIRRRVINHVENNVEGDAQEKKKAVRDLLIFVNEVLQ